MRFDLVTMIKRAARLGPFVTGEPGGRVGG